MDTLEKISHFFREKSFFKEILYIGLGLLFIFLANLFFHFEIDLIPNYQYINSTSKFIFLLVMAYFSSRILCEIGDGLTKLTFFLIKKDFNKRFNRIVSSFNEYLSSDLYQTSEERLSHIYMSEIIEEFTNSKFLRSRYDEADVKLMISNSLLGFSLIIIIVSFLIVLPIHKLYLFLLFIFLLINSCFKEYNKVCSAQILADIFQRKGRNIK